MATMRAMLGETLMPGPQPRHKCLPPGCGDVDTRPPAWYRHQRLQRTLVDESAKNTLLALWLHGCAKSIM